MNIVTKECFRVVVVVVFLLCSIGIPRWSLGAEQPAVTNVIGSWVAEPVLGQLGRIQVSYTFKADGSFSKKLDMLSFCGMGAVSPDCEYYWMVTEGNYSVAGSVVSLRSEKGKSIQLRRGQTHPVSSDLKIKPQVEEFILKIEGGKLILTDKKKGESQIFVPGKTRKQA